MNEVKFTSVGNSLTVNLVESWSVTSYIRWIERASPSWADESNYLVLQQLWQGSHGSQKWEDVPTVREE